jgi:hypothetical protein
MTEVVERVELTLFLVNFSEERTERDTDHDIMGWGIQFPGGDCYIDWNRHAYSPKDRLQHPHVSIYGGFADVEQGTGGDIEVIHEQTIETKITS